MSEEHTNNRYWIDRERYFELKHFCLQYKNWNAKDRRRKMIDESIEELPEGIGEYILIGVTDGLSYDAIVREYSLGDIKDKFYDAFRKFFWLLDKKRK